MADFSISYRVNEEDLKKLVYINPVEAGVDVGYLLLIFYFNTSSFIEGKLFP